MSSPVNAVGYRRRRKGMSPKGEGDPTPSHLGRTDNILRTVARAGSYHGLRMRPTRGTAGHGNAMAAPT